jgi:SAM-dependent methyltransferase
MNKKFNIQDEQYEFPYHYLAQLENNNPKITEELSWGLDYLTYMDFTINKIQSLNIKTILDVGCGDGYLLNHLEDNINKEGIDLSTQAIKFANAFSTSAVFKEENIFNITKKYDLVSLIEVLEHLPDDLIPSFIERIESIVQDDGYFIITVPTTVVDLNEKHYRHYDEELLNKHLPFKSLKLIEELRVYNESTLLNNFRRLLINRFYTIKSEFLWTSLWKWHKKNTYSANKKNGLHLIRIYKKC